MNTSQNPGSGYTPRPAGKRGTASHDLTERQKLFALEYLTDLNATQAAIRAGYSAKTAKAAASRLLTNVNLQVEIQKAMDRRCEKLELKAEDTLKGIANIARFDPRKLFDETGSAKDIHELDLETAQALSGFDFVTLYDGEGEQKHAFGQVRKIRFADRLKAFELLGRHLGLFKDRLVIEKDEFEGRSPEELRYFAEHGKWPDEPTGDGGTPQAGQGEKAGG